MSGPSSSSATHQSGSHVSSLERIFTTATVPGVARAALVDHRVPMLCYLPLTLYRFDGV